MKGNCGECQSRWYCDIDPDKCNAWPDPIPQTNADHIRSMTDEELADFIDSVYCHGWSKGANGFSDDDPYYHDWLKQPYGGDT